MYRVFNIATPHQLDQHKTFLRLLFCKANRTAVFYTTRKHVWTDFTVTDPLDINPNAIWRCVARFRAMSLDLPIHSGIEYLIFHAVAQSLYWNSPVGRRSDFSGDSYLCNTVVPVARRNIFGDRIGYKENYPALNKIQLFTSLCLKSSPNSLYKETTHQQIRRVLSTL